MESQEIVKKSSSKAPISEPGRKPVDLRTKQEETIDTMTEFERSQAIEKAYDREMVTGVFRDLDVKGGQMEFPFRKYRGDKLIPWKFKDGEVRTIPRMVAHHINTNCKVPVYKEGKDEEGRNIEVVDYYESRFSFQSLEFGVNDDKRRN